MIKNRECPPHRVSLGNSKFLSLILDSYSSCDACDVIERSIRWLVVACRVSHDTKEISENKIGRRTSNAFLWNAFNHDLIIESATAAINIPL